MNLTRKIKSGLAGAGLAGLVMAGNAQTIIPSTSPGYSPTTQVINSTDNQYVMNVGLVTRDIQGNVVKDSTLQVGNFYRFDLELQSLTNGLAVSHLGANIEVQLGNHDVYIPYEFKDVVVATVPYNYQDDIFYGRDATSNFNIQSVDEINKIEISRTAYGSNPILSNGSTKQVATVGFWLPPQLADNSMTVKLNLYSSNNPNVSKVLDGSGVAYDSNLITLANGGVYRFDFVAVPEPTPLQLFGIGLGAIGAGALINRYRKNRKK